MVTQNLPDARWRIEERAVNGAVLASANLDDRERAFESFVGWRRFLAARAAAHGNYSPAEPYGAIRLVLIDRETHVIAPPAYTWDAKHGVRLLEGPAL